LEKSKKKKREGSKRSLKVAADQRVLHFKKEENVSFIQDLDLLVEIMKKNHQRINSQHLDQV